ncbi:MAG: GNAT family N-acetyltransferase [Flavobacteriaceae bacterium]
MGETKIRVRQMQRSDLKAVMQIKKAENWNQTQEDWLFLLRSNPEYCLVALIKNQVIGTVTAINYQNKVAWIGMMLVAIDFRGMGVSKLLINTVIHKLKDCASIKLDATPVGIPVYKKLGFVKEYEISRMVSTNLHIIDDNQQGGTIYNLSPLSESELSNIASLDASLFGVNRSDLFRFLLGSRKEICLQIKEENQLKGYVLGRNGSNYIQIGPLMTYSTPLAQKLLYVVFESLKDQALVIDVLSDKAELKEWLLSLGFIHQRSFSRMHLKSNGYAGKTETQYAISGPELG